MDRRPLLPLLFLAMFAGCGTEHLTPLHNPSTQIFTFSGIVPPSNASGVTHIMAVNGESSGARRVLAPIAADGSFSLPLVSNRPWLLTLLNATQSGSAMTVARLKGSFLPLATFPPFGAGSLALGQLTLDVPDAWALPALADDQVVSGLALSSPAENLISAEDRLALRYLDADLDGDGVIDAVQGHSYQLDFQLSYDMVFAAPTAATINDVVTGMLPATTQVRYAGTGIYVSYPSNVIGAATGTVTFGGDGVTPGSGGIVTSDPGGGSFAQGTAISAVTPLTLPGYSGFSGFGVNTAPGSSLPFGKYVFSVGGTTLTFGNVSPPGPLGANAGQILPFVHLVKTDSVCFSNCQIGRIDYEWRTPDPYGNWVQANADQVVLLASDQGAFLTFEWQDQVGSTVAFALSNNSVTGSVAWDVGNVSLTNVSPEQFYSTDTSLICHLRLYYDDKIGVRRLQTFYGNSGLTNDCGT